MKIYTDGATFPNPGRGGWAWIELEGRQDSGGYEHTTNQEMELVAIMEAIQSTEKHQELTIVTDSMYAINCLTVWCHKWINNGWKTKKNPVKHRAIIERTLELMKDRSIMFEWVKGHSGCIGNEAADELATTASKASRQLIESCQNLWRQRNQLMNGEPYL